MRTEVPVPMLQGSWQVWELGRAATVAPIDKLSVVLVALFGVLFLHEKLSVLGWIGILLIGSGAIIVALAA